MPELPFHNVVDKYHSLVQEAILRIMAGYNLLNLKQLFDDSVPRSGDLANIAYNFHGIGCTVSIDGYRINCDWDEEGRTDQFEAWKLWQMTRDHSEEFGGWADLQYLRDEVFRLDSEGEIEPVDQYNVIYRLKS